MIDEYRDDDPRTALQIWIHEVRDYIIDVVGRYPCPPSIHETTTSLRTEPSPLDPIWAKWFADGMPVEEAADRSILFAARKGWLKPPVKWICFPEWPRRLDGEPNEGPGMGWSHLYRVESDEGTLAYYDPNYYRSVNEVLGHLTEKLNADEIGGSFCDYVVWHRERAVALIRVVRPSGRIKVLRFTKTPDEHWAGQPHPGWPTYEEWVASGRGPLTFDKEKAKRDAKERGWLEEE